MSVAPTITPNFFVVGAPKAGTTSLYRYLDEHPAIFMSPVKEPCFFAPEVVDFTPASRAAFERDAASLRAYLDGPTTERRAGGIVVEWEQYVKLFKRVRRETAIGEVSGNYLASHGAARAIRDRIPHARIVMVLRNPAERLFSQFVAARAAGAADEPFGRWLDQQLALEATRHPPFGPVWTGRYAEHVRRYEECFPRNQVRVYLYDDYARAPAAMLRDLFTFLGVNPDWPVDATRWHNVPMVPRWPAIHRRLRPLGPALRAVLPTRALERARRWYLRRPEAVATPADRARLLALYDADIRALETWLGRDLQAWRRPEGDGPNRSSGPGTGRRP